MSEQEAPMYQTNYMMFYIRVYPDRVEFRDGTGEHTLPINHIASVQVGTPLLMQITLETTGGLTYPIPIAKKKEVQQAIYEAQEHFVAANSPQVQSQTAPTGIPIDIKIQQIKLEIEQRRLQLRQVNTEMANVRSHYQQRHAHGGGEIGDFVRAVQRSSKDAKLRKQQPAKERLQGEKLALEHELNQLKLLKAQGVTHIK